jgi:succinylglutamate desuccinylase
MKVTLLSFIMSVPTVVASLSGLTPGPLHKVVVVGGTHGNEYTGVWCIKALDRKSKKEQLKYTFPSLEISTLLGNPQAHMENKRFCQTDLNRQFSQDALEQSSNDEQPQSIESRRAQEINQLLGPKSFGLGSPPCDSNPNAAHVIVDLHTTTANMGITLIVAEGDTLMTRAAAYVLSKCGGVGALDLDNDKRCSILMHRHKSRDVRPSLCTIARHGFTIEVGAVPQGVLRHDAVEKTQQALDAFLEFLERHNQDSQQLYAELEQAFCNNNNNNKDRSSSSIVPCWSSVRADANSGSMSSKIEWPSSDPDNPNFPAYLIHKSLQDQDFTSLQTGDVLFVDLDGTEIPYNGSHGSPLHLIFINEGGYYFSSSGIGIAVAMKAGYDLDTGKLIE